MSRSVGLREDQREGHMLATLIQGLFPVDPVWGNYEQARLPAGSAADTLHVPGRVRLQERACSR